MNYCSWVHGSAIQVSSGLTQAVRCGVPRWHCLSQWGSFMFLGQLAGGYSRTAGLDFNNLVASLSLFSWQWQNSKREQSKQGLLRPRLGTGTPCFCHILLAESQAPPRFKRWGDRSHFLTVKLRSHYEGYQYKEKGSTGAICTIKNPKPINMKLKFAVDISYHI